MAVHIRRRLVVDRIRFFVTVTSKSLYSHMWNQLYEMAALKGLLLPGGEITVGNKGHGKTRLRYCPEPKRCIAIIQIGTGPNKKKYFSLDLFPEKFQTGEFEGFKEMLSTLLDDFNYTKLFHTAQVSYLELATDSLSWAMGTFIPFRVKTGSSYVYQLPDDTGGIYLGAIGGPFRICIYDKRRQIIEKLKKTPVYKIQTRIEVRLRSTGLAAVDLLEGLENNFLNLEIADREILVHGWLEPEFHAFLERCVKLGACLALKSLTAKDRRVYLARMRKAKANWWRPEAVWTGLPSALAVLNP